MWASCVSSGTSIQAWPLKKNPERALTAEPWRAVCVQVCYRHPEWRRWSTSHSVISVCICAALVDGAAWGSALAARTRLRQWRETGLRKSNQLYQSIWSGGRQQTEFVSWLDGSHQRRACLSGSENKRREESLTNMLTLRGSYSRNVVRRKHPL